MRIPTLFILLCFPIFLQAQTFTQTVRGHVTDMQTRSPIPGATVLIADTDPLLGASTDMDGYFTIEQVPIGRITIKAAIIGYTPVVLQNIELTSGKELILEISMEELITALDAVEIKGGKDKMETNNEMTTVSARQFTIEESMRFAGARNDVSRMAQNFAGVKGTNDAVNDIIIRGNSPVGLLWRLEDVDIPNPNHFGDFGSTGGPVSMLNNNVLANSDFLTGAFPAEYGNSVSGVFDLRMRNGNNKTHEFLGQIGLNGIEAGAEGPLSKHGKSSYLINYRYSTLGIMSALGINFGTGTAIPYYQDVTFKCNVPISQKHILTAFGLGGKSSIDLLSSTEENTEDNLYIDYLDVYNRVFTGIAGVSYSYLINNSSYIKTVVAVSSITNKNIVDSVSYQTFEPFEFYAQKYVLNKGTGLIYYKKKFDPRNNLEIGIRNELLLANLRDSILRNDTYTILSAFDGDTWLIQPYAEYQHKFSEKLVLNAGLHVEILSLNNSKAIEPRAGLKYIATASDIISLGYGEHSMMAPLAVYFQTADNMHGDTYFPNADVDLIHARHLVAGYDHIFGSYMHAKVEVYYQDLFSVLADRDPSSYSSLNTGTFSLGLPDSVDNSGTGYNYGAELTVEKFLSKGYYYLFTTSIYRSKYTGSDGVERNTAFAGDYVINALAGKEFHLGTRKGKFERSILLDLKMTTAGGQRYTPIDLEASIAAGEARYDNARAFSEQYAAYFRMDGRLSFKVNGKNASQEWAVDIQNITDHSNPYIEKYNAVTQEVITSYQLGIFPVAQYRITF
ncbi:MAG: TonB-dependent receptor [Chitinophagales bacterium]